MGGQTFSHQAQACQGNVSRLHSSQVDYGTNITNKERNARCIGRKHSVPQAATDRACVKTCLFYQTVLRT